MTLDIPHIFDTQRQELVQFSAREPGQVGVYVCGPTVYQAIHLGNARPFITFSWLRNYLEHLGYDVTLVMNITDINDKIYAHAKKLGENSQVLAARMADKYIEDTNRLGLGRPSIEPRVSDTIPEIISMIEILVEKGHAYEAEGDVYFSVRSDPEHGKLAKRKIEDSDPGEGLEGTHLKRDPIDFALWKATKPGEDSSWDSPWGMGRPAWHIECSAMGEKHLGAEFEIHGGGSDLLFPHHENEATQTRSAHNHELAQIWMHSNMLLIDGEKMAKSVGNVIGLDVALDEWGAEAILYLFATTHYRQPVSISDDSMEQIGRRIEKIKELGRHLGEGKSPASLVKYKEDFFAALSVDFHTAKAVAAFAVWMTEAFKLEKGIGKSDAVEMLSILGLDHLLEVEEVEIDEKLNQLLAAREAARSNKDWAAADSIREEFKALGWQVRDSDQGPELLPL